MISLFPNSFNEKMCEQLLVIIFMYIFMNMYGMYVSQPKHPWCKKSCGQESKKGHAEKM